MVSIFVQISSYRDLELLPTIEDAIAKSSGNYTIRFGVHRVLAPEDEVQTLPAGVKLVDSVAPSNIGVNIGREIANSLYDGEDYYYQIDSHTRFVQGWDMLAISDLKRYQREGIEKPLLTQYPGNFWYDDEGIRFDSIKPYGVTKISFNEKPHQFNESLIPTQTARGTDRECAYTFSVSAANIFTLGEFAYLPRDTRIAFWGEEILTAATAFCHGFRLVVPRNALIWHLYHSGQPYEKTHRHHAWQDYPEEWQVLLAGSNKALEESLLALDGIDEFGEFAGLDFRNRTLINHQLTH